MTTDQMLKMRLRDMTPEQRANLEGRLACRAGDSGEPNYTQASYLVAWKAGWQAEELEWQNPDDAQFVANW